MPNASRKKGKTKSKKSTKGRAPERKPAPKPAAAKAKGSSPHPAKTAAARPGLTPASAAGAKPTAKPATGKLPGGKPATVKPATSKPLSKTAPGSSKKGGRKSGLLLRRGPNGELLSPGDILLPGGVQGTDEVQYLFRGAVAAEHPAGEAGTHEILSRRAGAEDAEKAELSKQLHTMHHRFEAGSIEPLLPARPQSPRRSFQTVVERAKHRRREIGAFLRGLDIGRTETSHMDSHGEASLQSLMEWAARLENLAEADEPEQADYAMFHRGLDQLESTTEALIIDVELTLRRLRDRNRAS
jgi:hypothetical protein